MHNKSQPVKSQTIQAHLIYNAETFIYSNLTLYNLYLRHHAASLPLSVSKQTFEIKSCQTCQTSTSI